MRPAGIGVRIVIPGVAQLEPVDRLAGDAGAAALALIVTAFSELQAGSKKPHAKPLELTELFWAGLHGLASLRLTCSQALTSDEFRLARLLTAAITDKISRKGKAG